MGDRGFLCPVCGAKMDLPGDNVFILRCLVCGASTRERAQQPQLDLILPESEGGPDAT